MMHWMYSKVTAYLKASLAYAIKLLAIMMSIRKEISTYLWKIAFLSHFLFINI